MGAMRTITVRDLRQRWPEAEACLQVEKEVIITRAGKPVAKLVRFEEPSDQRKRFDPKAHAAWQRKMSGGKVVRWVDEYLSAERNER